MCWVSLAAPLMVPSIPTTPPPQPAAFYWIPSLAGPTSVAAQKAGAGTAWLFPFVDGAPPIGWDLASRYLALPVALVIAQYISNAIVQPPQTDDSDAAKFSQNLVK